MAEIPTAHLKQWISRWDRQQEYYLPNREERFDAMFTVLRHLVLSGQIQRDLRLLDLGCGPGAIGQRLLTGFPEASYVGVDIDPVLLTLARAFEPEYGERFKVLKRDLSVESWSEGFADGEFDVVASSTALHWLKGAELDRLIAQIAPLLSSGGVFFNLDHLAHSSPGWQDVAASIDLERQEAAASKGKEDWASWWSAATGDPYLADFAAERAVLFPASNSDESADVRPMLGDYVAALDRAGFVDIDVLWQEMDDRLLAARCPIR